MKFFSSLIREAQAHCDVPCGIYDPATAQTAALSVARFLDLIAELDADSDGGALTLAQQARLGRLVEQKETHAMQVKNEIVIIWGDYFKAAHIESFPHIHELTHQIMQKASACKQDIARENGVELVELVNRFAEAFWASKNVETQRCLSNGKPVLPLIKPVLQPA